MIAGIDVGYGDTKVVINGKTLKFPTAVAPVDGSDDDFFTEKPHFYLGRHYVVGRQALMEESCITTRNENFLIKYVPLVAYVAIKEAGVQPSVLATGLPLGLYLQKDYRDKFKASLSGFEVDGERMELDVLVFAQGHGVFLDYVLDDEGNVIEDRVEENVLVLDIGFNTVDVLCVRNGKPTKEGSTTLYGRGIAPVCVRLSQRIADEIPGITLTEQEAKDVLTKRYLKIYGRKIDVGMYVDELLEQHIEVVMSEIETRWKEFMRKADRIVLAGGGAYYYRRILVRKHDEDFIFSPENPEFANARGYYKGALRSRR